MTIDDDVAAKAKEAVRLTGMSFKSLINKALRVGIEQVVSPPKARPYQTKGTAMGLRKGLSYDKVADLLSLSEGDEHR
jgi:hypothetical protein